MTVPKVTRTVSQAAAPDSFKRNYSIVVYPCEKKEREGKKVTFSTNFPREARIMMLSSEPLGSFLSFLTSIDSSSIYLARGCRFKS